MTSLVRRVAGGLTVLEGLFAFYSLYENTPVSCPASACPLPQVNWPITDVVTGLAIVLLVEGALGVWGASFAYTFGAVFSVVFLSLMGYTAYLDSGYPYLATFVYEGVSGVVLGVVALVANALGMRDSGGLSEQANPMNLPVFG